MILVLPQRSEPPLSPNPQVGAGKIDLFITGSDTLSELFAAMSLVLRGLLRLPSRPRPTRGCRSPLGSLKHRFFGWIPHLQELKRHPQQITPFFNLLIQRFTHFEVTKVVMFIPTLLPSEGSDTEFPIGNPCPVKSCPDQGV